jgi:hypothetical protein
MQIILVQAEIETAITDYIRSQINIKDNVEIHIDFQATRGADGYRATVDISPTVTLSVPQASTAPEVPAAQAKAVTRAAAAFQAVAADAPDAADAVDAPAPAKSLFGSPSMAA